MMGTLSHIVTWKPEGRYNYSTIFHSEPEGWYRCTKSLAIVPFWFLKADVH